MRPSSILRLLPAALALTHACSFSEGELHLYSCADSDTDGDTDATPDSGTDAGSDAGSDSDTDADSDGGADGGGDDATRILFVGNSYTYVNDLPGRVLAVAESLGLDPPVEVATIASGGAWLADHAADETTMAEIEGGGWDFVVLQEQSYLPVVEPTTFYAAAETLAEAALGGGAAPALLETWARAEGNELYEGDLAGYTPTTMQAALRDAYTEASELSGASYLPVGDTWEETLAAYPSMPLHGTDGSHPSQHGTYLSACVVLTALTGAPLDGAGGVPDGVSEEDAAILRGMAE